VSDIIVANVVYSNTVYDYTPAVLFYVSGILCCLMSDTPSCYSLNLPRKSWTPPL